MICALGLHLQAHDLGITGQLKMWIKSQFFNGAGDHAESILDIVNAGGKNIGKLNNGGGSVIRVPCSPAFSAYPAVFAGPYSQDQVFARIQYTVWFGSDSWFSDHFSPYA